MIPDALARRIERAQAQRLAAALRRDREARSTGALAEIRIGPEALLNFASNDYLGLAQHPALADAAVEAIRRYGTGSTASALLGGYLDLHADLERRLAAFLGFARSLVFPSGYHANLALLGTLARPGDLIVADRFSHASLLDAAIQSRARLLRYAHADPADAAARLAAPSRGARFLVSDGVFSMDGDSAPVRELADVAQSAQALLVIDDAHGIGVLGPRGAGVTEGLTDRVALLSGTFGKAFGAGGAFIAGPSELIEAIVQAGRSYRYTTALAPPLAAAALAALRLIESGECRARLLDRIRHFRVRCAELGIALEPSASAIQPIVIGGAAEALAVSRRLRAQGFFVPAVRPPTVPVGTARLRISVSAAHSPADLDRLVTALRPTLGG